MSLDLNKVAPQVGEMVGRMSAGLQARHGTLRRALRVMGDAAADLGPLKQKIEESKTTWLVAGLGDGLDRRYSAPPLPADFAVLAADGSHIEVDRHQAVRCFLLNVGRVMLCYGSQPDALLESLPTVYFGDQDLAMVPSEGRGREQVVEGNLLGAKRSVEECRHLADLAATLPPDNPVLALLDGTLMLWGLESYPDFVTELLLERGLLREFDRLRRTGRDKRLVFGSFISAPRSTDVVNVLRVAVCPHGTADCDRYCQVGGRDCDGLSGLTDYQLFFELLALGERSAVFSSRSRIVAEHYGGHAVHFFYLKLEDEIARIEAPAWVAYDESMVGLMHGLVLDQCRRGHGYPVVLSEAHEQAVVTTADRRSFWQLVEAALVEEHLPTPTTGKSWTKRTRWV